MEDFLKLYVPTISSPALEKANFPIFSPNQLPNDLKLREASYRIENPKREYPRCSLKLMLKSESTGKVLYIKEFNYDWAPPAYDCPSLWKNHEEFAAEDTPEPQPHLIENDVLWIGFNYRNQRAASIIKERTTIEMVGDFSDQELVHIARGLTALDKNQRERILSKSFAELSYGYPKAVEAVNVTISFWKFPVADSQIKLQTAFMKDNIPTEAIVGHLPLPSNSGYKLDSVFAYHFGEIPSAESRYNFVYEHEEHKGSTIQLQHVHKNSPAACAFPPLPDQTQKFKIALEKVGGVDCYYAYRSENYGPHELIFQRGNFRYLMLVKPASWTSKEWFFKFLGIFLKCHDGFMQYKKEL
jgi:hypothetical protein